MEFPFSSRYENGFKILMSTNIVLKDLNFIWRKGECVLLDGAVGMYIKILSLIQPVKSSVHFLLGSGKSSLIRVIGSLWEPFEGRTLITPCNSVKCWKICCEVL